MLERLMTQTVRMKDRTSTMTRFERWWFRRIVRKAMMPRMGIYGLADMFEQVVIEYDATYYEDSAGARRDVLHDALNVALERHQTK